MKKILVVCTANVCRSPLVAALLQQRIARAGLAEDVRVESAGVRAVAGYEVDPVIAAMLDEMRVELAKKHATPVVEDVLREADLVLVMEEAQRQALFYRLPSALPKIFLLSELAGRFDEVADPYGMDAEVYYAMQTLAMELLDQGWSQLLRRLNIENAA
ncbi:MAG: low molecular weight phosphotyrosine protein phosphatase [Anaerolineales bacterium]|nr:low molecular weight phosphotyrosine protein phosphatase [Anaerolineales bacterium]